jgi:hypothetical protein
MSLETASFIAGLDPTNPTGLDDVSQGDDHVRLVKQVLKNTLPNADAAITASSAVLNAVQDAANLVAGLLLDARVQASNVTQHAAAIAAAVQSLVQITAAQVVGGTFADALIAQSNVTQHEGGLGTVSESGGRLVKRDADGTAKCVYLAATGEITAPVVRSALYDITAANDALPHSYIAVSDAATYPGYNRLGYKTTYLVSESALLLGSVIQLDPGGTPTGRPGQQFFYY